MTDKFIQWDSSIDQPTGLDLSLGRAVTQAWLLFISIQSASVREMLHSRSSWFCWYKTNLFILLIVRIEKKKAFSENCEDYCARLKRRLGNTRLFLIRRIGMMQRWSRSVFWLMWISAIFDGVIHCSSCQQWDDESLSKDTRTNPRTIEKVRVKSPGFSVGQLPIRRCGFASIASIETDDRSENDQTKTGHAWKIQRDIGREYKATRTNRNSWILFEFPPELRFRYLNAFIMLTTRMMISSWLLFRVLRHTDLK